MADVPIRLYLGQPGTTATTIYTAPATVGSYVVVRGVHIANATTAAATITLGIGGVTAAVAFYFNVSVPASGALDWTGMLVLAPGETVQSIQGTALALTVTASGISGP